MIIDVILDRKDGQPYNPKDFYLDMLAYGDGDNDSYGCLISKAMDYSKENEVKKQLINYINDNEYSDHIIDYIKSVNWLTKDGKAANHEQ